MKKVVLAASAALLIAIPGLSLAQEDHHHEGGGHPSASAPAQVHAPTGGQPAHMAPTVQAAPQFHGPPQGQFHGGQPNVQGQFRGVAPTPNTQGFRPQGSFQQGDGGRPQGFVQPGGAYRPDFHGQPGGGGRSFAQDGRGQPGAQAFGYGGRQYFRYRAAPYRYPGAYYGWANHSWRRGEWLPPVFIAQDYFINDWYDFGLWQPNYGYEWVRVGADALLVSLADGQVVDVVPGVYYY